MATAKLLLGLFCFALVGERHVPDRNLLVLDIAQGELGVREATGKNDGTRVEAFLAAVKLRKGNPWCAAFVSWVFKQAAFPKPRTGWSPDLFPASRLLKKPAPGAVFGIYFPELKRIAHCGFVEKQQGNWVYTLEGNTNVAGSREGDGIYRKMRQLKTIYRYANWGGMRE